MVFVHVFGYRGYLNGGTFVQYPCLFGHGSVQVVKIVKLPEVRATEPQSHSVPATQNLRATATEGR
jgi:hypothetical protein